MSAVVAGFRSTRMVDVVGAAVADALRRHAAIINGAPNLRSVSVVTKIAKTSGVRAVIVTIESESEGTDNG